MTSLAVSPERLQQRGDPLRDEGAAQERQVVGRVDVLRVDLGAAGEQEASTRR